MPDGSRLQRQRDRILRASFPSPGLVAEHRMLTLLGCALLIWLIYSYPSEDWVWCSAAALCLAIAVTRFVADTFEPLVALLARALERVPGNPTRNAAADIHTAGLGVLTKRERRRIASARLHPLSGRSWPWIYLGIGAGFLALWLSRLKPLASNTSLLALLAIAVLVFGRTRAEYYGWQPLIAALRTELGEERAVQALRSGEDAEQASATS